MCKCMEALMKVQELPNLKGIFRFIDSAQILAVETSETTVKPVLRALKEGKDGRLTVSTAWMPVYYCPNCGAPVESWAQPELEEAEAEA